MCFFIQKMTAQWQGKLWLPQRAREDSTADVRLQNLAVSQDEALHG